MIYSDGARTTPADGVSVEDGVVVGWWGGNRFGRRCRRGAWVVASCCSVSHLIRMSSKQDK